MRLATNNSSFACVESGPERMRPPGWRDPETGRSVAPCQAGLGSQPKPLLGSQRIANSVHPGTWNGPVLQRLRIPAHAECGPQCTGVPTLFASRSGAGQRWYRSGGRTHQLNTGPDIDLYSADYERDHARWQGLPGETVAVRLSPEVVRRLLREEAEHFDLQTRYEVHDERLHRLVHELADELEAGMPSGALYCEGVALAMMGLLVRHYAATRASQVRAPSLSEAHRQRVRALIEDRLGEMLSVGDLAEAVCLSPFHFTRLFKASFGTSPHRYVLQRRLDRAMELLKSEPAHPIADVAATLGFASQSHLTHAFARYTGMTPSRWRSS